MNNGISIEFASHTTPLPSSTWKSISEEERIAKVKSAIKDFPGKETIEIKQAHFDELISLTNIISLTNNAIYSQGTLAAIEQRLYC